MKGGDGGGLVGGRATLMTRIEEDEEDPKSEIRSTKSETNSNEGRLECRRGRGGETGGEQHG